MPEAVEKMTPTPNSQGVPTEGSSAAGSDKKRNKLGYHRTSVACVHCRRRKIRCLVAQDDAQGRCENCIRLRKECQYFPVDQQPPIEKKSRPNSRVGTTSTEHSTASLSPSTISGTTDQREAFFPYQPMPLTTNQEVPATGAGTFAGNPMAPFTPDRSVGPAEFTAPPPLDPSVDWDEFTTISDPQMLASMNAGKPQMMSLAPNVWNPGGTPVAPLPPNPPVSGTPPVPTQSQPINAPPGFAMQPTGSVWPIQPAQSMTFPAQPEMTPYPTQFPQNVPPDIKPRIAPAGQNIPSGPGVNPPQPPVPGNLQTVPVSYPGQQQPMDFQTYQDMGGMRPMNVFPYPMFSNDAAAAAAAAAQQANFRGGGGCPPPMRQGQRPGQGHHTSRP